MEFARVVREPFYFGRDSAAMLGWLHRVRGAPERDCVAVLCAPIGTEYIHGHRSMRHLADRLALKGVATLRFDYEGCGDSHGGDEDPDRVSAWTRSVGIAVSEAKRRTGRASTCLIGLRLGASLAARACADEPADLLVLWNPVIKGRTFVREMQAAAAAAERPSALADGGVEGGGYALTSQTADALKALDLLRDPIPVRGRALLVSRDDQAADPSLAEHLARSGVACDGEVASGWAEMMAEPHFTRVPEATLDTIARWVEEHSRPRDPGDVAAPAPLPPAATRIDAGTEERLVRFGPASSLFGVLCRPLSGPERPTVVMFNAGSVHHVGPHRLYVTLARRLAARGFPSFRFDLSGLGDSVLQGEGRENHPYPSGVIAEAREALAALERDFGLRRFIVLGLCSGAHSAFHAGLEITDRAIEHLVLINPLTYYWREGMSLETVRRFWDVASYRSSARSLSRWLQLLRGEVELARPTRVALAHARGVARSYVGAFGEMLFPAAGPRLARDLRRIFAMGRRLTLVVSEGDPGYEMLREGARWTTHRGLATGRIRLVEIAGADHTFSQSAPRAEVSDRVVEALGLAAPTA